MWSSSEEEYRGTELTKLPQSEGGPDKARPNTRSPKEISKAASHSQFNYQRQDLLSKADLTRFNELRFWSADRGKKPAPSIVNEVNSGGIPVVAASMP